MGEQHAPPGGQRPIFSLDIVNHRGLWPRQQRGYHQTDALSGSCRRERHDVLRTVVAQIGLRHQTEEDTGQRRQLCLGDVPLVSPAGGAVSRDVLRLPRAPDRTDDRGQRGDDAAAARDRSPRPENVGCIGVVDVPPFEQAPRVVDRKGGDQKPGFAEALLKTEMVSDPLGCGPCAGKRDAEHDQHLSDEHLRRRHSCPATAL